MLAKLPGTPWPDSVKPWVLIVIDLLEVGSRGRTVTEKLPVRVMVEAASDELFASVSALRNAASSPAVKSAADAVPPRQATASAANETPALKAARLEYRPVDIRPPCRGAANRNAFVSWINDGERIDSRCQLTLRQEEQKQCLMNAIAEMNTRVWTSKKVYKSYLAGPKMPL